MLKIRNGCAKRIIYLYNYGELSDVSYIRKNVNIYYYLCEMVMMEEKSDKYVPSRDVSNCSNMTVYVYCNSEVLKML